jgi:hypothetical protein
MKREKYTPRTHAATTINNIRKIETSAEKVFATGVIID